MGSQLQAWTAIADLLLKLVIAGWGAALFFVLRQREQAQATLRKTEIDIRHIEKQLLELDLKTRQAIEVDIKPTVSHVDGAHIIFATVELFNRGSQSARIAWHDQEPAFTIRRVTPSKEGKADYQEVAALRVPMTLDPQFDARAHIVRGNGKEALSFVAKVPSPGIYLLSFRGVVDEADRIQSAKQGAAWPVAWTANRHVVVEGPRPAAASS